MQINKDRVLQIFYLLLIPFAFTVFTFLTVNSISDNKTLIIVLTALSPVISFVLFRKNNLNIIKKTPTSDQPAWIYTLSCLVSLYFSKHLFENSDFALNSFDNRTIGVAVLSGVDVAARTNLYLLILAVSVISLIAFIFIFSKIETLIQKSDKNGFLSINKHFIFVFSVSAVFMQIYRYINGATIFVNLQNLFVLLSYISFCHLLGSYLIIKKNKKLIKIINDFDLQIFGYIFPLLVFFIRWIAISGSFVLTYEYYLPYLLLFSAYWISLVIFSRKIKINSLKKSLIPLAIIPSAAILTNEVQYALSGNMDIGAYLIVKVSMLILVLISLLVYFKDTHKHAIDFLAENLTIPIVIFTATLFYSHINFINLPNGFDTFHHGENLLTLQQLWNYGKIPFIDLYPTHGLSYFVGQFVYSLVNGYSAISPWLFEWIKTSIELLALYYFLKKVVSPLLASILIIFFPFLGIFGGKALAYGYNLDFTTTYYLLPLIVGLAFLRFLNDKTAKNTIVLWITCLAVTLWRIDFGIASSVALLILMAVESRRSEFRKHLPEIIKSALLFFGGVLLIFLTASLLKSEDPINLLTLTYYFVNIQSQAQGLIPIAQSIDITSFWQYFVLPAIAIFYVVYFLYKNMGLNKTNAVQLILVFVALTSLIISLRSVQRQSLATIGYNPYLFGFLLITLPIFIKGRFTEKGAINMIILLFAYQMFFPNSTTLIKEKRLIEIRPWNNHEERVDANRYQLEQISEFLKKNLSEGQTFLDLTSSPLLYVDTNKEFVNYFIPSAYITSDYIQEDSIRRIDKYYEKGRLPLVVFRQKEKFANNIDGVPNEIRSYKIYEYLYSRYEPLADIDGYLVWKDKRSQIAFPGAKTIKSMEQDYHLKLLPYFWGAESSGTVLLSEKGAQLSPGKPVKFNFDPELSGLPLELVLNIKSSEKSNIIFSAQPGRISFDTVPHPEGNTYTLRISTLYNLYAGNVNSFTLMSDKNVEITSIKIIKPGK